MFGLMLSGYHGEDEILSFEEIIKKDARRMVTTIKTLEKLYQDR